MTPPSQERKIDLTLFKTIFAGREDCYGTYASTDPKDKTATNVKLPLTDALLTLHLEGKKRIGRYQLKDNKCKWSTIDYDENNLKIALTVVQRLKQHYNLPSYTERSKGKGYHIHQFFDDWIEPWKIRAVMKMILEELDIKAEIFPKQDKTSENGYGNFMNLPMFNLKNNGGYTVFLNSDGEVIPDQVTFLESIEFIPASKIDDLIEINNLNPESESYQRSETPFVGVKDPFTEILSQCEYLDKLHVKGKEIGHLEHEERIYFANVFLALPDGKEWLVDFFKHMSDFDFKITEYQLKSLKGIPTLCKTMCGAALCQTIEERGKNSPIAFAFKNGHKENVKIEVEESKSENRSRYPIFPDKGYLGLADEFASGYSKVLESPKVFFYFTFQTFLGTIAAPYLILAGALKEPCRIYPVLIGPSASPRKSTVPMLTGDFFEFLESTTSANRETSYFKRHDGVGSAEGLAQAFQRSKLPILLFFDEFKSFVDKAKQDGSVLLPMVTSLFSTNRWSNHTKDKPLEVNNAHLSLIAACTEDTFQSMWTSAFLQIGFINRLFLVAAESTKLVPKPPELSGDWLKNIKKGIRDRLFWLIEQSQADPNKIVKFDMSTKAEKLWDQYYRQI